MFLGRHPDCEHDASECRIRDRGSSSTLMAWYPTYDGLGNQTNQDPNIVKRSFECRTCERTWVTRTHLGETVIVTTRTPNPDPRLRGETATPILQAVGGSPTPEPTE